MTKLLATKLCVKELCDKVVLDLVVQGSLETKTSENMGRWKGSARKKLRHGESQREKMQVREEVGKSRNGVFQ